MIKKFIKSFLNPSDNLYKILSHTINYAEKGYLPRKINTIENILTALSLSKEKVNFVQVGSNDGISGDPLNKFINDYDWHGILVEPIPFLFEKLKTNYFAKSSNLIFLNIAVSADIELSKNFYSIDEQLRGQLPDWYFQLGSFYKNILYNHEIPNIEHYIKSIKVPVNTIQNILKEHKVEKLDLIHIDTEGYDFEILKTINLKNYAPQVVLAEYINLNKSDRIKMLQMLKENGFKSYKHHQDFISIHRSVHKKLMKNTIIYPKWI